MHLYHIYLSLYREIALALRACRDRAYMWLQPGVKESGMPPAYPSWTQGISRQGTTIRWRYEAASPHGQQGAAMTPLRLYPPKPPLISCSTFHPSPLLTAVLLDRCLAFRARLGGPLDRPSTGTLRLPCPLDILQASDGRNKNHDRQVTL